VIAHDATDSSPDNKATRMTDAVQQRSSSSVLGLLFRVIGRRPMAMFGLVSCLIVALLAAVTVTSRHAMQRYVADQVERLPWDISIYQTAEVPLAPRLRAAIMDVAGVAETRELRFLRTIPPYTLRPVIDGLPLRSPWISILSSNDPTLIPPEIRPTGSGTVAVLVGSKTQMGDAYLKLQNRKRFELVADHKHNTDDLPQHQIRHIVTLTATLERVVRLDASELNRWFLEHTSSPTLVPELGLILVTPWDPDLLRDFDHASRGFIHTHDGDDIHISPGEYFPEVIHLVRLDRKALLSGWDIEGSLRRITVVGSRLTDEAQEVTARAAVDHNLGAMFVRMNEIAQRIALVSLLVALPLLIMAAVLLANLSNLLLLNERRKLGLLRLRGVSRGAIGAALLLAIGLGGLVGGIIGAGLGTIVPLVIYMGALPPLELILKIQQPLWLLTFLTVGLAIVLFMGARLVRDATQVSPLEAVRRIGQTEGTSIRIRFGLLPLVALLIGAGKLGGWMADWSLTKVSAAPWIGDLDRILDFVAFPLFIYGFASLIASREKLMAALMAPAAWLMAGPLRGPSLQHMQISRHRAASFMLVVALLASLALYPTVMTAVFDNKTERGARVQLGSDLQVTLNALDYMPAEAQSRGGLQQRVDALRVELDPLTAKLRSLAEVRNVGTVIEGIADGLYMPDRGFSGLPIYFTASSAEFLASIYSEPALGESDRFASLLRRLDDGRVIVSSAVSKFYKRTLEQDMPVGRNAAKVMARAPFGGSVYFLPGTPLRTVNDREGFIGARVDYLNHLFAASPYLVSAASNPALANLDVLLPRVVLTITGAAGTDPARLREAVLKAIPAAPLDVRDTKTEVARLGSDMYVFLARQNVQIYLLGGLLLALIGITSIAYANYVEDRRTLALLRIRGAGPLAVVRFFLPNVLGPSLVGLIVGSAISLIVGFGITRLVWELRQLQTVMNYLPTQLAVSQQTGLIALALIGLLLGIVLVFGRWVFTRTARESLLQG
jgi:hypothetical protein